MDKNKLNKQLNDWLLIYNREMAATKKEGATEIINGSHAMNAHLKAANLSYANVIKIMKMLGEDVEETSELKRFMEEYANN